VADVVAATDVDQGLAGFSARDGFLALVVRWWDCSNTLRRSFRRLDSKNTAGTPMSAEERLRTRPTPDDKMSWLKLADAWLQMLPPTHSPSGGLADWPRASDEDSKASH
jgi:hypothetical protein